MFHMKHGLRIFFYFVESLCYVLKIFKILIFNHPMICQICDVIMSISTWDRVQFWVYLLNHNSLSHQTQPNDRHKQGQYFSGIFWTFWRVGAKSHIFFNLATCCNYSITNYVKIPVFNFFEKVKRGHLKIVNANY